MKPIDVVTLLLLLGLFIGVYCLHAYLTVMCKYFYVLPKTEIDTKIYSAQNRVGDVRELRANAHLI